MTKLITLCARNPFPDGPPPALVFFITAGLTLWAIVRPAMVAAL